ncbi:MAG: hypothetical protein Q8M56_03520, partial [Desulfobacterales bacterium]|nr:hypothetical protein [Desulfobacterales bacterium]
HFTVPFAIVFYLLSKNESRSQTSGRHFDNMEQAFCSKPTRNTLQIFTDLGAFYTAPLLMST